MKRRALCVITALCALAAQAQSICFWTDEKEILPIRIYIDEEYLGDVTKAFSETPVLDTEGCLSVDVLAGKRMLTAVDKYGRIYEDWPGYIRTAKDKVYSIKLSGKGFRRVSNRSDYPYVFVGWDPLPYYYPPVYRHHGRRNPREDDDILAGMAVGAVTLTAAMTALVVKNWDFPDARFPYWSLGWNSEYLTGLNQWRNTLQGKARFGNLGGISLIADIGVASPMERSFREFDNPDHLTWSIGAGLDYGGLGFSIRYKAGASSDSVSPVKDSYDTFLIATIGYDWWVSDHLGINVHTGFGLSGNVNYDGLMDNFEYPIGFGLLYKF